MRLVLDTNVVVSALIGGAVPYKLIEAAAAGDIELVTSPALLAELRIVLGREHLASRRSRSTPVWSRPSFQANPGLPSISRRKRQSRSDNDEQSKDCLPS